MRVIIYSVHNIFSEKREVLRLGIALGWIWGGKSMNDKGNYQKKSALDDVVENDGTTQVMNVSIIDKDFNNPSVKKGSYCLTLEGSNKAMIFDHLGKCASFILTSYLDARLAIDQSFSAEETSVLKKSEHLQNLLGELKRISCIEYDDFLKYTNQQIKNMKYCENIDHYLDNVICTVNNCLYKD